MNRNLLLVSIVALALVFLVGCAEEGPGSPDEPTKEMAIDPGLLPPPRQALETAPDLSNGRLEINDQTLGKMSADGVPAGVLESLKSLQGRPFTNAVAFADAVKQAASGASNHMDTILRDALITDLADPPEPPLGQISIAQGIAAARGPSEFDIVFFDFDKSNIKPEFVSAIQNNANKLLSDSALVVTIEGHCDERGTNEYNLALGQRRAESIRRALIAEGVPAAQLNTVSFGEERPAEMGSNEEAWAKNRRGEMVAK